MVLEELDAAAVKMPSHGKSVDVEADESLVGNVAGGAKENPLLRKSKRWWRSATSLAPGGVKSSIVSCRLKDGTRFMAKHDCLSRGGTPKSVSG